MPFRKRRHKRRRRRTRRCGMSTRAAAFKALAATDQEKKNIDATTGGTPVFPSITNPVIIALPLIAEGTNADDRIGRKCKLVSISIIMRVTVDVNPALLRCMLVLDRQPNGALFNLSNLLIASTTNPFIAPRNMNNAKRFKVLKRWNLRVDPQGFGVTHSQQFIRLGMSVQYNGVAAGIGTVSTNMLALVIVSSTAVLGGPVLEFYTRLRFVG